MSQQIVFVPNGITGTLYATANVVNSTVFVKSDGSFETFNVANWLSYVIVLTVGPDGLYYGQFPVATPNGAYAVKVYQQAGANPTPTDSDVGDSIASIDGPGSNVSGINWVTLQEYKLANAITDSSNDDRIVFFLGLASAACATYLDRNILSQTYTRYYPGYNDTDYLDLIDWPVTAVSAITVNNVSQDVTNVWVDNLTHLHAPYYLTGGVTVTYTAGYISLPLELKMAVINAVQAQMQISSPDVLVKQKTDKNVTIEWNPVMFALDADPMFAATRSVLDKYKRIWVI